MVSVIQSLSVQQAPLKKKDSIIADLQSKLKVSAGRRETDKDITKLHADVDHELARLRGELEEKTVESLKHSLELVQKDSELQSTWEKLGKARDWLRMPRPIAIARGWPSKLRKKVCFVI